MSSRNTKAQDWLELMDKFNEVGLESLPKLLGTQKEFESGCIPRQDSLEMLTEGESVINECPSGIGNIKSNCGENFDQMIWNNSEQMSKTLSNLHTPKIIYLSDGKSIPTRKNRRK